MGSMSWRIPIPKCVWMITISYLRIILGLNTCISWYRSFFGVVPYFGPITFCSVA